MPFGGKPKPYGVRRPSRCSTAINSFNLGAIAETAKQAGTILASGCVSVMSVAAVTFPLVKTYMTVERIEKDLERIEVLQKKMAKKMRIDF